VDACANMKGEKVEVNYHYFNKMTSFNFQDKYLNSRSLEITKTTSNTNHTANTFAFTYLFYRNDDLYIVGRIYFEITYM